MITKKEAINIGKQIIDGMNREVLHINNCKHDQQSIYACRGATLRIIENIYYDVLPCKVRDIIGTSSDYKKLIGWQ